MHGPFEVQHGLRVGFWEVSGGGSWPEVLFSSDNALADVITPCVLFINSPTSLSGKNSNRKARSYPSPVPVTR